MPVVITPTRRPLRERLLDWLRVSLRSSGHESLRNLDMRALADIGLDASEIASIEAESRGSAVATRRRVVAA